jgi:two-component sensor histidine kinase
MLVMTNGVLHAPGARSALEHKRPWVQTVATYEHELAELRRTEGALREVLACEDALLHQKNELIQLLEILSKESDHRFLNGLQMIASLLSMQARTASNPETASQLTVAANRVIMIGAIHRRLHCLDGTQTVAFRRYLEELCRDFSTMLGAEDGSGPIISVDAIEAELPSATSIPLGFIVSELITNAIKYGKGQIKVRLEASTGRGYALSVFNDGPNLPSGFDPAKSKGAGMTIVRSLVAKIGGKLTFGPGDQGQGACFAVMFG